MGDRDTGHCPLLFMMSSKSSSSKSTEEEEERSKVKLAPQADIGVKMCIINESYVAHLEGLNWMSCLNSVVQHFRKVTSPG